MIVESMSEATRKELIERIKELEQENRELNKSDASKEQSSMNYYNLYKELVDKIKAKIEEIDKILERNLLVDRLRDYFDVQKEVLHSLLEKE